MSQQIISVGSSTNDGTGDSLRSGAVKINSNFTELYSQVGYVLPSATPSSLGGVAIPAVATSGLNNINGVISLATSTTSQIGGVKVDGTTITINDGVISSPSAAPYNLPTASTTIKGGVKIDGTTIVIDGNGVVSSVATNNYILPVATTLQLGGVKVDGSTITITAGVISANYTNYTLPPASTTVVGGVKIDGSTITLNGSNQIVATAYSLPTATTSVLGGVKVDGSTITINGGTISANGLTSRASVATTTASLAATASATATVTAAKGYALYSIQVSAGAWVTVYTSSTAQSNDSSRNISTDPAPGSGVVAEAITTTATTTYFTPAVYGFNSDPSTNTNMYLKIYNNSGSTTPISVTITYLKLEI
jgi:hypothetical protein